MDPEKLKSYIRTSIQALERRKAALWETISHLEALERYAAKRNQSSFPTDSDEIRQEVLQKESQDRNISADAPASQQLRAGGGTKTGLLGARCLKCGFLLDDGELGGSDLETEKHLRHITKSDGVDRYIECPQCSAKNIFVSSVGPGGHRTLLLTRLKQ